METFKSAYDLMAEHCYMRSKQQVELETAWVGLHIRKKPKWMPEKIYHWLLSKLVFLDIFHK